MNKIKKFSTKIFIIGIVLIMLTLNFVLFLPQKTKVKADEQNKTIYKTTINTVFIMESNKIYFPNYSFYIDFENSKLYLSYIKENNLIGLEYSDFEEIGYNIINDLTDSNIGDLQNYDFDNESNIVFVNFQQDNTVDKNIIYNNGARLKFAVHTTSLDFDFNNIILLKEYTTEISQHYTNETPDYLSNEHIFDFYDENNEIMRFVFSSLETKINNQFILKNYEELERYFNDGYNLGYDDGYDLGYSAGATDGYNLGYDDGFDDGKINGYNLGLTENINNLDGFSTAKTLFQTVYDILDIKILGFISIGSILLIVVVLGIFMFIYGLIKN